MRENMRDGSRAHINLPAGWKSLQQSAHLGGALSIPLITLMAGSKLTQSTIFFFLSPLVKSDFGQFV